MNKLKDKRWKVIHSEYLSREPWLTVRKEEVELPNGNRIPSYYVLEYPDWINIIAITRDGHFVMIDQYRHGLGVTEFELCAGVCEKEDGSPLISAQRELLEETGYGNGNWHEFMTISPNPGSQNNLTHCFLAKDVEKIAEQNTEPSEDINVHLFTIDDIRELMTTNQMQQATQAAPLWKYLAMNHLV